MQGNKLKFVSMSYIMFTTVYKSLQGYKRVDKGLQGLKRSTGDYKGIFKGYTRVYKGL